MNNSTEILRAEHILDERQVVETAYKLSQRISDRFPKSDLARVARVLHEVARETGATVEYIGRTNWFLRLFIYSIITFLLLGLGSALARLNLDGNKIDFFNFVQISDAGLNVVVLVGAAIVFLISIENKAKRKRVIRSINKLRGIAHVIDMHQLTKDPHVAVLTSNKTQHSPARELSGFLLQRYLNYCSEMLSITSKIAFLYAQKFEDSVCMEAVNDLETLCNGLSRKIWQKLVILSEQDKSRLP